MTAQTLQQRAEIEQAVGQPDPVRPARPHRRGGGGRPGILQRGRRQLADPDLGTGPPAGAGTGGRLRRARPRPGRAGRPHAAQPHRARARRPGRGARRRPGHHVLRDAGAGADRLRGRGLRRPDRGPGRGGRTGALAAGAVPAARAEDDHRQGRRRVPGRSAVPDLGRLRRARQGAVRRRPGTGQRAGGRRSASTPGGPALHLGNHRQPEGRAAHPPQRRLRAGLCAGPWASFRTGHGGCPTCRSRTSRSACSASTCPSTPGRMSTSARIPTQLVRVVGKVRPNGFFGVPRVWEKIRAGIESLFTLEQDEAKRAAVAKAMEHRPALRGGVPVRAHHAARAGRGVRRGGRGGARADPRAARPGPGGDRFERRGAAAARGRRPSSPAWA